MMKWAEGKHDAHRHFFMRPTHTCAGGARAIGEPVLRLFGDTGTATARSGQGPAHWWTTAQELLFWIICPAFYLTRGAPAADDLLSSTLNHWLQMCLYFFHMIAVHAPETMSTEQFRSKASMILCKKVKQFPAQQIDFPDSGEPYSSCSRGYVQWDQSYVYHILLAKTNNFTHQIWISMWNISHV